MQVAEAAEIMRVYDDDDEGSKREGITLRPWLLDASDCLAAVASAMLKNKDR